MSVTRRNGDCGVESASTRTKNCDRPPARLTHTTNDRATSRTIALPWSDSASRQIEPADTPARVYTSPSRTKIEYGSTRVSGGEFPSSRA